MFHTNTVQAVLRRMRAPVAVLQFIIVERSAATGVPLPCGRFVLNFQAAAISLGLIISCWWL